MVSNVGSDAQKIPTMGETDLTQPRARALFDILTHHETYLEVESFKRAEAARTYGPPLCSDSDSVSSDSPSAPLLQLLVTRFATTFPGLRDIAPDFWQDRCRQLLEDLGDAELSESYDKGAVGLRRTLATAASVLLEYPIRGCLGGYSLMGYSKAGKGEEQGREYDVENTDDVVAAWNALTHELVHGDTLDQLFEKVKETEVLEEHTSMVRAAHEYILVNVASLLFHIIIVSPDGEMLISLLDNINKLIPYTIVRSSLKIGNAATMINAMVKLFLAKFNVGSWTNWMGLSTGADEGMNLLQQIISTVLSWDIGHFRKSISKIERESDSPSKPYLQCIKDHIARNREAHQSAREKSQNTSKSMVMVIFEEASLSSELSESQHIKAAEYLAAHLSIRDREQLIRIACKRHPDLLTQAIRDAVAAFEPIIRAIHDKLDLSDTIWDTQCFIDELIKLSKTAYPKKKDAKSAAAAAVPSMEDFVRLLKKHQGALHKFLHRVDERCPYVRDMFYDWCKAALSEFRNPTAPTVSSSSDGAEQKGQPAAPKTQSEGGAGAMTAPLTYLLSTITSPTDRAAALAELDAYASYLDTLADTSAARMSLILSKSERTLEGPGPFLARWEALVGDSKLSPATSGGPVRSGWEGSGGLLKKDGNSSGGGSREKDSRFQGFIEQPKVDTVVRTMGPGFREMLQRERFAEKKKVENSKA